MRRIDMINSANKLQALFSELNLPEKFQMWVRPSDQRSPQEGIFETMKKYSIAEANFNDVDREIISIFRLDDLSNSKTWAALNSEAANGNLATLYSGAVNIVSFLTPLIEMLKQDNIKYHSHDLFSVAESSLDNEESLLTIILPESGKQTSSVERIIIILQSIDLFHEFVISINNFEHTKLSVAAIDSGSDKSFDLLGFAKTIAAVKEILFGIWDRIVLHREKKAEQRIELVLKTLPALEMVHNYRNTGKITPEQATRMQNMLETAVEKFLKSGAILEEFHHIASNEPREIISTEPKLIGMQTDESASNTSKPTKDSELAESAILPNAPAVGFTAEQMNIINKLVEDGKQEAVPKKAVRSRKPKND